VAELTNLESKLGEVMGLAQAGKDATQKVKTLAQQEKQKDLVQTLTQMAREAGETAKRCNQLAGQFKGKKSAISEKAKETKEKAAKMMETYLDDGADALDGFEFLTMAEAGEVGHWTVVEKLNQDARNKELRELVRWAKPIQQRHLKQAIEGSVVLAREEDPNEPAS
jgi:NTP pyrophosphatase (non-canonical NTP hydrolase)